MVLFGQNTVFGSYTWCAGGSYGYVAAVWVFGSVKDEEASLQIQITAVFFVAVFGGSLWREGGIRESCVGGSDVTAF